MKACADYATILSGVNGEQRAFKVTKFELPTLKHESFQRVGTRFRAVEPLLDLCNTIRSVAIAFGDQFTRFRANRLERNLRRSVYRQDWRA